MTPDIDKIDLLMARFEGMDDATPTDRMPTCRLFAARHLTKLLSAQGDPFLERQILDLVSEACCWHAHCGGKRWNPLEIGFMDFRDAHEDPIMVWETEHPFPPVDELRAWLMTSPTSDDAQD